MSEIKSNSDDLVLNSDGGTSTIKFQTNGVERGSISTTGAFTATTIDATALTGALPAISGASLTNLPAGGVAGIVSTANATAITIDANENVALDGASLTMTDGSLQSGVSGTFNIHGATGTAGAPAYCTYGFNGDANTGMYSGTADTIKFATGGSEKLRILSGGGITFNGDTTSANALDDYEEGDWTPAVTSTGGSLATTIGRYTKTGRVVHLFCLVVSSVSYTYANSTDLWTITGVPFAEAGQGYTGQPGSFYGRLNWNNSGSASTTNSIVTPTVSSTSIQFNVCNSADVDAGNARIKCANNASFVAQVNVTYYTNA